MLHIRFAAIMIAVLFYACSPAPRYHSNSSKIKSYKSSKSNTSNKKNKFDRKKTVYRGVSSYYGPNFHGKLTANGEVYDMYGLTAAHKEMPLNTIARVTNLENGTNIFEWTISDPCGSSSTQVNIKVEIVEFFVDEVSNYNGYNISCKGFSDGSITVYSIGGYPPYNYNWIGPENFTNNNQNIDNLSSGLYECTIIDSLGCEKTISYTFISWSEFISAAQS